MTISDYQVSSVIRTYMKSMKAKAGRPEPSLEPNTKEDEVSISKEAMKKMLYDRIGEQMTEKLKKI